MVAFRTKHLSAMEKYECKTPSYDCNVFLNVRCVKNNFFILFHIIDLVSMVNKNGEENTIDKALYKPVNPPIGNWEISAPILMK